MISESQGLPAIEASIVLTTYNRAASLRRTLESLADQTVDRATFEVIVVDNNSTDDTPATVRRAAQLSDNVVYVLERSQGVSHARNRGIREARGAVVGFIDDDAIATEDWIERALECFRSRVPQPQVVGGMILPLFIGRKPDWAPEVFWASSWGPEERYLEPGECFYGSNMFFTKETLSLVGEFDPDMGVLGTQLRFGDDDAYFDQLWAVAGPKARVFYDPQVQVFHGIPPSRLTVRYRLRKSFAGGQSTAARRMGTQTLGARMSTLPRLLFRLLRQCWRAFRSLSRARSVRLWLARDVSKVVEQVAILLWVLGVRPRVGRR